MRHFRNMAFFAALFLFVMACKSDKPPAQPPHHYPNSAAGVWVANEGNFMFGNADVSFYDPLTKEVANNVYSQANGLPLGDVLQSMYFSPDSLIFLVVNNSSKIEVVNQRDFTHHSRITGLTSPRYMVTAGSKSYVSDLYAHGLHVINHQTATKTGFIPLRGWTEALELIGQELWVGNMQTGKIYAVNTQTDQVIDSVAVGIEPNSMVHDQHGNLWVLCGGKDAIPGSLWKVNPQTRTILNQWSFSSAQFRPSHLVLNGASQTLHFIWGGVQTFELGAETWPPTTLIAANGRNFYGLGLAPNGDWYVSDAMDYVRRGFVYRYDAQVIPLDTFAAGIIPSRFYFGQE